LEVALAGLVEDLQRTASTGYMHRPRKVRLWENELGDGGGRYSVGRTSIAKGSGGDKSALDNTELDYSREVGHQAGR
jgi:hypothetical protein